MEEITYQGKRVVTGRIMPLDIATDDEVEEMYRSDTESGVLASYASEFLPPTAREFMRKNDPIAVVLDGNGETLGAIMIPTNMSLKEFGTTPAFREEMRTYL